jgi:hypothetical protein
MKTLDSKFCLAHLLASMGDLDAALTLWNEVAEEWRAQLGASHVRTVMVELCWQNVRGTLGVVSPALCVGVAEHHNKLQLEAAGAFELKTCFKLILSYSAPTSTLR